MTPASSTSTPPSGGRPDVTAIIVTYESRELVGDAIRSIETSASTAGLSVEILVVDNASSDNTADLVASEHAGVGLIRNDQNVGYAAANNIAFGLARGTWWLLLNPDARLDSAALGSLVRVIASDDRLAAVAPRIDGAGVGGAESAGELPGLRSLAGHFLLVNRLPFVGRVDGAWRGWQLRASRSASIRPAGWVSGAAVVLRPAAVRDVGGFDGSLFLYGEDLELGYELGRAGWRLAVDPEARASHEIGGSQRPASTRWIDGIEGYLARRRRSTTAVVAALTIVGVGLAIRALAGTVTGAPVTHQVRMRAGARHALARAGRRAFGGAPPWS